VVDHDVTRPNLDVTGAFEQGPGRLEIGASSRPGGENHCSFLPLQ